MARPKKKVDPKVTEYLGWVTEQKFESAEELYKSASREELDFLQMIVYPMFYSKYFGEQFRSSYPFPLILKDYSTKAKPIYVINNNFYTIIFFSKETLDGKECWKVSFHVKDHFFCDERIREFKIWYKKYCGIIYTETVGMPSEFDYPALNLCTEEVEDFCIEFWNRERNYILFKFFDLMRIC